MGFEVCDVHHQRSGIGRGRRVDGGGADDERDRVVEVVVIPVAGRPDGVRRLGICHGSEPDEESDQDEGEHGPGTHGGL
jgi:hypothetical protein